MSNWAAIVFGRTYEVDFRFLATPANFTHEEMNWARNHILVTTRSSEKLREQPFRWSVFKNERICVVGVTCMAHMLSEDMTEDFKNRPLYLFVGYVSRQNFTSVPPMDIELFKPLYKYVRDKWDEKSYDSSKDVPISTEYKHLDYPEIMKPLGFDDEFFSLNQTNTEIVRFWEDKPSYGESLWTAASYVKSTSVCIGLASQKDALKDSPFLNVVAADIREKNDLPKNTPTKVQRDEVRRTLPPVATPLNPDVNKEPQIAESRLHPAEIAGTFVVAALMLTRFGLPGLFIGAGIGYVGAGWLSHSGFGGMLRDRTDEVLRSPSQKRSPNPEDGMEYLRRKSSSNNSQNNF